MHKNILTTIHGHTMAKIISADAEKLCYHRSKSILDNTVGCEHKWLQLFSATESLFCSYHPYLIQ